MFPALAGTSKYWAAPVYSNMTSQILPGHSSAIAGEALNVRRGKIVKAR
jgi:hypothetical protein